MTSIFFCTSWPFCFSLKNSKSFPLIFLYVLIFSLFIYISYLNRPLRYAGFYTKTFLKLISKSIKYFLDGLQFQCHDYHPLMDTKIILSRMREYFNLSIPFSSRFIVESFIRESLINGNFQHKALEEISGPPGF